MAACAVSLMAQAAWAAVFMNAGYDPQTGELVVTLAYRGTHPDHDFHLEWGECKQTAAGNTIAGQVLDEHWDDPARKDYTRTVRFPLDTLPCRPAVVTLHTEPDSRISVSVPSEPQRQESP